MQRAKLLGQLHEFDLRFEMRTASAPRFESQVRLHMCSAESQTTFEQSAICIYRWRTKSRRASEDHVSAISTTGGFLQIDVFIPRDGYNPASGEWTHIGCSRSRSLFVAENRRHVR